MQPFAYLRPDTLNEAVALLVEHGTAARLLSGGTDLIVRLRLGHVRPAIVLDTKRITDLGDEIVATDTGLRIGARVTMSTLIRDERVKDHFPALVESASVVGSVQIRNRATLVGNICNASPAADTAPALLVYGALVGLVGTHGRRQLPVANFFTGPGRTVIAPDEIVHAIELPFPRVASGAAFGRVTRRRGVDLATLNLCGLVTSTGEARFAFGAVGPTPFLVVDATGALAAGPVSDGERGAALRALTAPARTITDVRGSREYRNAMLDVMTRRTWARAVERLRGQQSGAPR